MKIYHRNDFLKLQAGIIFCKGNKWCFDNMSIKGLSLINDFLYVDLCNIDANDPAQLINRLEDSLSNGTSYAINNDAARDGMFNDSDVFLVFEEKDLNFLIDVFKISINSIKKGEVKDKQINTEIINERIIKDFKRKFM